MQTATYYPVKELSPLIQTVLKAQRYGGKDIQVIPADHVSSYSGGNDGQRGFVILVNLDTGKSEGRLGSWGGSNPFTFSPVDQDTEIPIPPNGAVIKGTVGYPRTFATIYAHPDAFPRFLPSGEAEDELTNEEQQPIYCFAAIKGGEYRRDEMCRRNVTEQTVNSLVQRGYLKRSKNGATQITTKGKNARTVRH